MEKNNDVILLINQQAQERIKEGHEVTNGSIGMMFLDNGTLPISSSIREVLSHHVSDSDLIYSSVAGEKKYLEALRMWFLGESYEGEVKEERFLAVGTPGGTGAVTLAFSLGKKGKSLLLIPSLDWPNYEGIADGFALERKSYNLFKESRLDLESIEKELLEASSHYDTISLIVNDPCHNPSGYSFSPEEWLALVTFLNGTLFRQKVHLIIDAAYIDFASKEQRAGMLSSLKTLQIPYFFCFSFSKTFSFYGLRIGALAIVGPNKETTATLANLAIKEARALWSVPNHMAMNAISELLLTPAYEQELRAEVENNRLLVKKRSEIFLAECAREQLPIYPYKSGFFVTLNLENAAKVAERLRADDIYLAPVKKDALRVALCCLPTAKIPGLAHKIALARRK
jgi:aromatic-amino-acid transaminase